MYRRLLTCVTIWTTRHAYSYYYRTCSTDYTDYTVYTVLHVLASTATWYNCILDSSLAASEQPEQPEHKLKQGKAASARAQQAVRQSARRRAHACKSAKLGPARATQPPANKRFPCMRLLYIASAYGLISGYSSS